MASEWEKLATGARRWTFYFDVEGFSEKDGLLSIELKIPTEDKLQLGADSPYTRERAVLLRTAGGRADGASCWCTMGVVLDVDARRRIMVVQADPARPLPSGCGKVEVVPTCNVTSHRRNFEALHRMRDLEGTEVSLYLLQLTAHAHPNETTFSLHAFVCTCAHTQVYKALMDPARTATVSPPLQYMRENLKIVSVWQKLGWLNKAQLGAVETVLQLPPEGGLRLIQGPPGTGKTTTVAAIVSALRLKDTLQKRHRILLCAPSNAAVDELLLRLRRDGLLPITRPKEGSKNETVTEERMIRLGTLENIQSAVLPLGCRALLHRAMGVVCGLASARSVGGLRLGVNAVH